MGSEAASARYVESVRKSGSLWGKALLGRLVRVTTQHTISSKSAAAMRIPALCHELTDHRQRRYSDAE